MEKGQSTINGALDPDLGRTVLGIMRYFQVCHAVWDFARFPGPEWDEFMHSAERLTGNRIHRSLGVRFKDTPKGPMIDRCDREKISIELEFTTSMDPASRRIRLDTTGDVWGTEFGARFPDLAEKFFDVALGIPKFVTFG